MKLDFSHLHVLLVREISTDQPPASGAKSDATIKLHSLVNLTWSIKLHRIDQTHIRENPAGLFGRICCRLVVPESDDAKRTASICRSRISRS